MLSLPESTIIAGALTQALPYLQHFTGKICVIKYGGNAMTDQHLKHSFARDIVLLKLVGILPVVVHGGGPQINQCLQDLNIASTFVDGLRLTDKKTMDVVEMVLGGKVNKEIVQLIQTHGGTAIGITGVDGSTIQASKLKKSSQVDFGFAGQIEQINTSVIEKMLDSHMIPIIAPIGINKNGMRYNVNADTAACHIAAALKAEKLLILTNTRGVLDAHEQLLSKLNALEVASMIEDGTISGGMLPKIQCALFALRNHVDSVQVIDGRIPHALLLELFTAEGIGTQIIQT